MPFSISAAANSTAELMELGKAEPLRMFDDYHGRVGNIQANFDNGCADN